MGVSTSLCASGKTDGFALSVGPGMYVLVLYLLFTYFGHADQSGGTGVFFNTVNVWGEAQQAVTGGANCCHFMPSILPLLGCYLV